MQLRARQFMCGFSIAVIIVLAVCGFIVVDLSTDRYMPGKVGPMLAVTSIGNRGIDFSFMGKPYYFDPQVTTEILQIGGDFKALTPISSRIAAGVAKELADVVGEWTEHAMSN